MGQHAKGRNGGSTPLDRLAWSIGRHTARTGDHLTTLSALSLHRRDAPTEPIPCVYGLGLAVTAQGAKQVLFGNKVFKYGPGQAMLTSIDLPMVSHITHASKAVPYLGLLLRLNATSVAVLASEMKLSQCERSHAREVVSIQLLGPDVLDALLRLVSLLDSPPLLAHIAPLIVQEVTVRLLAGPHGSQLRQVSLTKPPMEQVARVVAWLKENFTQAMTVDALAASASMSPSAFRQHFRTITGMSPLQFQKQLRLQEARQLMLNQNMDAGSAADLVGYESVSQFSREYRRQFGAPPQRDMRLMRSS